MQSQSEQDGGHNADSITSLDINASENIPQVLLNHTSVGILLLHNAGIIFANPAIYNISQNPENSLTGSSVFDLFHSDSEEQLKALCSAPNDKSEHIDAVELKLLCLDRNIRWVTCESTFITVDNHPATLISMTDITRIKQNDLQRAEQHSLLLAAIEQSPSGIMIVDCPQMIVLSANKKAIDLQTHDDNFNPTGASVHECANKCHFQNHEGGVFNAETCPLIRAIQSGETVREEEVVVNQPDGSLKYVLAHAEAVRNENGEIIAGIIVTTDFTEQKTSQQAIGNLLSELREVKDNLEKQNQHLKDAETRIRASLDQYTDLYENAPVGYLTLSNQGIVLRANSTACDIFGLKPKELVGNSALYLVVNRHKPVIASAFQKITEEMKPVSCEVEVKFDRAARKHVRLDCMPTSSSDKNQSIRVAVIDVSARKQAEIKLAQSEQRYRMIVENPLSIVAVIDENYEVTFASPGLCDTIGYPYRELIGMDFRKVLTDEQREMIADRYIRRRRGENTPHQYGIDLIAKNGEIRSTIANISLATGPNGEKQSIVNMVDITDRKEINGETNQ